MWFEALCRRHARLSLGLLGLLVLAEGTRLVLRRKWGDFGTIYEALRLCASGEDCYAQPAGELAFLYSPAFAVVCAPLGLVPKLAMRAVWWAVYVAVMVLVFRWSRSIVARGDRPQPGTGWIVLAVAPVGYFLYYNSLNGQANHLMLGLVVASYLLDLRGRQAWSGVLLGAAVGIKPFPLLFVPFYALRGRWRVVAGFAATLVAGALGPWAWFGSGYGEVLAAWRENVAEQQSAFHAEYAGLQSVWSFWHRAFGTTGVTLADVTWTAWPDVLTLVTCAVVVAWPWWGAWRSRAAADAEDGGVRADVAFAQLMVCWAMVPPTGWKHYYLVLVFPCVLLAQGALAGRGVAVWAIAVAVAIEVALQVTWGGVREVVYGWSGCLGMGVVVYLGVAGREPGTDG